MLANIALTWRQRWGARLKVIGSVMDADDREIIYQTCWRAGICFVGVIGAAATAGLAWTVFRLTGGF